MFSGQNIINLLYDRRYDQAGWMLQVLAVALIPFLFELANYCLLALGLAKIFTQITAISVVGTFVAIPTGFHFFGISGALWGIVVGYYVSLPAIVYFQIKHGFFDLSKEILLMAALPLGMILGRGISYMLGH
jgi:O-antigen/teichoic acid export membrane protein